MSKDDGDGEGGFRLWGWRRDEDAGDYIARKVGVFLGYKLVMKMILTSKKEKCNLE